METYVIEFNTFEKLKVLKILEALEVKFTKIPLEKEKNDCTSYSLEDYTKMLEDAIQSESSIVLENSEDAFQYLMKK
jgi:hypothetical protein